MIVDVVPAALPPEDEAHGFADLEFYDPANLNTLLPYVNGAQKPVVLKFDDQNWDTPQTVKFQAKQDAASEGTRYTFINHTVSKSTDPFYVDAQVLSVKVQINDDDRAGVIVTPKDNGNTVLEGGFPDTFEVVLTRAPDDNPATSADVTVTLSLANNQVDLDKYVLTFSANGADANAWNKPQTVTITAKDDAVVEGFHTDYISYTVTSPSDKTIPLHQATYKIDGDPLKDVFSDGLPDDIEPAKATSFLFLADKPLQYDSTKPITPFNDPAKQPVIEYDADGDAGNAFQYVALQRYTNETDSVLRYSITGNTLEFYRNGRAESISGAVRVSYYYVRPGYDGVLVADSSVDIYDNDAPMVIVKQTDGSTDVIERAQNASDVTDYYTIELSKAPAQDVTITVDPSPTRTVLDGRALFQEQVEVSLTGNPGTWFSSLEVVFSPNAQAANGWNKPVKIYVRALFDTVLDGSDNQVFAPEAHTVNKIRGPLLLEGAAGSGSLSLPAPLMLPGEINLRPSDGTVQGFTPATTAEGFEYVKVKMSDLQKLIDDATKKFDNLADFIDKTFELTEGPGTGVVLDAGRPRDLFDRFWLIKEVQDVVGDSSSKLLKLQNPTAVDP